LCQAVDGLGDQLALQGLEAQLEANFAQQNAQAYAAQLFDQEQAARAQAIQQAEQAEQQDVQSLRSSVASEQSARQAAVTSLQQQERSDVQGLQNGLQQEAQAREQGDQAEHDYAGQQASQAQSNAERHADTEVAAAAAAAAAALAGEAATLEAEIAAVEGEVGALAGLAGDAILGNALLTLLEDGLLFGFLAAAVKFPKQTADASVDAIDPVMGLAGGALDALIGWAA
jgi:hypothetical protein